MNVIGKINKFLSGLKPQSKLLTKTNSSKYILNSKTERVPISSLNITSEHIPEDANFYSMISVGKKDDKNFERNIVTFYKDKDIVKRIFSYSDRNPVVRTYDANYYVKNDWSSALKSKYIKTTEYDSATQKWRTKQEDSQFTYVFLREFVGNSILKKLHINKNIHEYSGDKKIIKASITEYPARKTEVKKEISATLSMDKDIPKITDITNNTELGLPKSDEFLPYRFLTGEQKQTSLTRYELNKNGLTDLDIGIYYSKDTVGANSEGAFDHISGNVIYGEKSKIHPIIISAHESEHARQFSLIGRLGKLKTDYGSKCMKKLPKIDDNSTRKEGFKYVIAFENYPKLSSTEDLKNNKLYWENPLEVGAREKADNESKLYEKGRKILADFFKYSNNSTSF